MAANPYKAFLNGQSPQAVLESTPSRLNLLLQQIPQIKFGVPIAPGKWSISQIMSHLADCEIAHAFRIRQAVADVPFVQPFDQDKWAESYAVYSNEAALETFCTVRSWNLAYIAVLSQLKLEKKVTHPERGTMSVSTIIETMAGHDLNHLAQIEQSLAPTPPSP